MGNPRYMQHGMQQQTHTNVDMKKIGRDTMLSSTFPITMNSLPPVNDPSFRQKLREAREARGLSQYALAKLAGIAGVMPKRYEDASDKYATFPNIITWKKLNTVLFPAGSEAAPGTAEYRPDTSSDSKTQRLLHEALVEEIVAELKRRGATSVVVNW